MKSRWRPRRTLQASAALLLLPTIIDAVSLTGCSSLNTGSSSGGSSSTSIYMSNGKCSDTCKGGGYAFAITQYQECFCSNYAPGDTTSTEDCSSPCPGFPSELCGDKDQGLYGYIALGKAPLGTQGGSSSSKAAPSTSQAPASSYDVPDSSTAAPTTVEKTSVVSLVSTAVYTPPTSSQEPSTTAVTVVHISTPSSSATATSHSSKPTHHPNPVTSTALVTVSGAIVTQVVTSTPTSGSDFDNKLPQPQHKGLSNGAVAGATIGALLGAALIGALIFFCWRRRRTDNRDTEGALSRNPSVLSRTGLLGSARGEREEAVPGATTLPTLPRLQTSNQPLGFDPGSAATFGSSQMSENKRSSRPMFVDNRLNPNALMMQANASRTSIGTLQDNQDYSRPLEVRNPD